VSRGLKMPYIWSKAERRRLDEILEKYGMLLSTKGNINYLLFKFAKDRCKDYEDYRAFIGELEACKLEVYRKLIGPYEDKKIKENGDVE
jgi:hypothetical protein